MKQLLKKGLLCMSASFFVCIAEGSMQKPWTILVYVAAANDSSQRALDVLQCIMQVGSSENVNVIAYCTIQEDGHQKVTKKLYIEQGALTHIGTSTVRDSGDLVALEEALQWACLDYPSDKVAVVLWGKGSGALNRLGKPEYFKGLCCDFDTGHYLTDGDCYQAFSWAKDHLRDGKKFDIIAFDANFSASIEMAYALASCADYMVASEDVIVAEGYPYAHILQQLAVKNLNALDCAQLMVTVYGQDYFDSLYYTLSAIDLNALDSLIDNCNAVAKLLEYQLMGEKGAKVKGVIKRCINKNSCPSFDQGSYIDLGQFYKNLLKNIPCLQLSKSLTKQFKPLLMRGIKLFDTIIKKNVTSNSCQQTTGLSIYFSRYSLDPSYYGLYWAQQNSSWLFFLEAFLS